MRRKRPAERSRLAPTSSCFSAPTWQATETCNRPILSPSICIGGNMKLLHSTQLILPAVLLTGFAISGTNTGAKATQFLGSAEDNSKQLIEQGRKIFRFDT